MNMTNEFAENQKISHDKDVLFLIQKLKNAKDICDKNIIIFDTIDSTNTYLKNAVKTEKFVHGTVVIAYEQTAGRGRLGRTFYSPDKTGLYMSILLDSNKFEDEFSKNPALFTVTAAVAVSRAIQKKADINVKIKWVNDLYLENKKICGILAEGILNSGKISKIVLGIGLNLTTVDFPEELQQKAGSLFGFSEIASAFRLEMAAEIIDCLFEAFNEDKQKIMSEYKKNSCVIGKTVEIITATETYTAKAIDITPNGELVVEKDNGSCVQLNSGEISLKLF